MFKTKHNTMVHNIVHNYMTACKDVQGEIKRLQNRMISINVHLEKTAQKGCASKCGLTANQKDLV